MVNIITKKGENSDTPFSITLENGSFIPSLSSDSAMSLLDSQKITMSYTTDHIVATAGGQAARNEYTYDDGNAVRDNAQMYEGYAGLNLDTALSDELSIQSKNLVSYQDLGVPGGLGWGLTPKDAQENTLAQTHNSLIMKSPTEKLNEVRAEIDYVYGRTFFHDDDYQDSTHNKHKGLVQIDGDWNISELITLTSGILYSVDHVESTDVGKNTRSTLSAYAHGGFYSSDGRFSVYPSVNLSYLSDLVTLSPNASLGAVYAPSDTTEIRMTVSYAENTPTFSELYWPFMGNEDLETEKGWNADMGFSTEIGILSYEGALFARDIYNAITYDSTTWLPGNIAHSLYAGTEQSFSLTFSPQLSAQVSYQYNKSYDLSSGQTISDNVEVSTVRKHVAKASLFFNKEKYDIALSGEYLGASTSLDDVILINLSSTYRFSEKLSAYAAVDNLLNASYELASGGYPMPGMKVRLGGTARF